MTRWATFLLVMVGVFAAACSGLSPSRMQARAPVPVAADKPAPTAGAGGQGRMPVYDPRIVEELAPARWVARTPLVHAFWGPGATRFELHLLFHRLPAPTQCIRQVLLRVDLGETAAGPFAFAVRASLFDFQANRVGSGPLAAGSPAGPLTLRPGTVATADVTGLYRRFVGNESRQSADSNGFAVVLKAVAIPAQGRASVWIRGGLGPTLAWTARC